MNFEEAREKLEIMMGIKSRSYDDALCDVIKFLLDEIERIKTPQMTVLEQFSEGTPPIYPLLNPPNPPDEPVRRYAPPHRSPPICDPIRQHRKDQNNAGDAT